MRQGARGKRQESPLSPPSDTPRSALRTPHSGEGGEGSLVILLTGAGGQIGRELLRTLAPLGAVVAPARSELDLAGPERIRSVVRDLRPALIVNAGAYTAVDAAEREPEIAHAINGVAPGVLAEEAARLDAPLVHYSTDYVFPGTGNTPYTETDLTSPVNIYGESKRAGEEAIRAAGAPHLILRTSWIYGLHGTNFARTMLRLARERDELRVVDDQVGAPTWCRMVAEATALIMARFTDGNRFHLPSDTPGTYHLTAAGETSWFTFAREILARDPARGAQRCRSVVPVASSEFPTPARRPGYSVLDNRRINDIFGIRLPHWKAQLGMMFGDLAVHTALTSSRPIQDSSFSADTGT